MRNLQQPLKLLLLKATRNSAALAADLRPSAATAAHPNTHSRPFVHTLRSWRSTIAPPPPPSYASLLLPAASRTLRVLLGGRGIGPFNSSPWKNIGFSKRSWSYEKMITPDGIVLSLIGANVAVFILWRIADTTFMRKNFLLSLENVKNGRLHTLLTSAFSHTDAGHIISNMIGLYFFGQSIGRLFGARFLLKMYLAGALGGSIFFLVHKAIRSRYLEGKHMFDDPSRSYVLGASAAVNAIILLDIFLFPTSPIYFGFLIPVPAFLVGAVFIGSDLLSIIKGDGRESGASHLGGATVAALMCSRMKGLI